MSSIKQRRSRLQDGYCIGVSRRSAQATVGKRLAQGPYVAATAEVEPTTLRLKVIDSTKTPPRPTQQRVTLMMLIFKKGKGKKNIINIRESNSKPQRYSNPCCVLLLIISYYLLIIII